MKIKVKKPDNVLVLSDMSACEVRTCASTSQDPLMIAAYKAGKDLYSIIASMCFHVPYEDCLEFYKEFTKVQIGEDTVLAGSEKEYFIDITDNIITIPTCYSINSINGLKPVDQLIIGDILINGTNQQMTVVKLTNLPEDEEFHYDRTQIYIKF